MTKKNKNLETENTLDKKNQKSSNSTLETDEENKFDELEDKLLELSAKEENEENNNENNVDLTEEDYEELKQKLLSEYNQNRNEVEEEESIEENTEQEEPIEENTEQEEPIEETIEQEEPIEETIEQEEPIEETIEQEEPIEENTEQEESIEETIEQEEPIEENTEQEEYTPKSDHPKVNNDKYDLDDEEEDEGEIEIEEVSSSATDLGINQPEDLTETQKKISPDVDQGLSKVAISKGSSMAMMILMGAGLLFIIYKVLEPSPEEMSTQVKSQIDSKLPIAKPIEDVGQTIVVQEIPKLPEVPTLSAPTPPPSPTPPPVMHLDIPSPPPPPPVVQEESKPLAPTVENNSAQDPTPINATNVFNPSLNSEAAQQAEAKKQAKRNSSMLVGGGGGGGAPSGNLTSDGKSTTILALNTSKIVATYIGELQRIIAQGKVIDAVLETAINTDLPGSLRAIVSRDVYSEAGQNILIPKGSRLIGTYNPTVTFGVSRVQILWSRVIRPDGVDVAIASTGIDNLGRSGTGGDVDNHVMRNLMTALMISTLDIAAATYLDKNGGSTDSGTTTTITGGVTSNGNSQTGTIVSPTITTGTPPTNTEEASAQTLDNINEVGKQLLGKTLALPPTITVDQGTPLKVYVQRDIIFPGRSANLTRIIE